MDIDELFDVTIKEADGGYDVTLDAKDHVMAIDGDYKGLTIKLRDVELPKIGSRTMIDGKLMKVKEIEADENAKFFAIGDNGDKASLG